eukprot:TRINITY_DN28528_c0_g1_i1.p1 TRINITY_DN28528_c0_g1~~TRINITY_DN28528_c0_g1_i1.p1  ORF type:complete len:206 (-),score=26.34 TRINITY_DN28528_c0_g1_i1:334-951(-)
MQRSSPNQKNRIFIHMSTRKFSKKEFKLFQSNYEKKGKEDPHGPLFRSLREMFDPKKVLYPGCHRHIIPTSLIFQNVTYVDMFKKIAPLFKDEYTMEQIKENKEYEQDPEIRFLNKSYANLPKSLKDETFDLLISLSAGIVSRPCIRFLKKGGILFVNDSHADARAALVHKEMTMIGAWDLENNFTNQKEELEKYFRETDFILTS